MIISRVSRVRGERNRKIAGGQTRPSSIFLFYVRPYKRTSESCARVRDRGKRGCADRIVRSRRPIPNGGAKVSFRQRSTWMSFIYFSNSFDPKWNKQSRSDNERHTRVRVNHRAGARSTRERRLTRRRRRDDRLLSPFLLYPNSPSRRRTTDQGQCVFLKIRERTRAFQVRAQRVYGIYIYLLCLHTSMTCIETRIVTIRRAAVTAVVNDILIKKSIIPGARGHGHQ